MQDGMRQRDDLAVALGCGHPNVQPGEKCPLCGHTLQAEEKNEEQQAAG